MLDMDGRFDIIGLVREQGNFLIGLIFQKGNRYRLDLSRTLLCCAVGNAE